MAAAADVAYPDGRLLVDQIGTGNLAPIIVTTGGQRAINPALAANHIQVIKDTHGKTSQLSQADLDALIDDRPMSPAYPSCQSDRARSDFRADGTSTA